jgi:hypothetical protein
MSLVFKKSIYLTIGAIIMFNLFGCSGFKFNKYTSKDSRLNLSMDYIAGWQYRETRGSSDSYAQVTFYQFQKGKKSPRVIMEITVKDGKKMQTVPAELDSVADELLSRRMKFKDAQVLSKSTMNLLNTPAIVIELSYLTLENLLNVDSKLIPVREKIIIFKLGDNFYFLRYDSAKDEFERYNSAFMHMVKTLTLNN